MSQHPSDLSGRSRFFPQYSPPPSTHDIEIDGSVASSSSDSRYYFDDSDFDDSASDYSSMSTLPSSNGSDSDAMSIFSLRSGDSSQLVRDLLGRSFNSTHDKYMLPADSEEHGRLNTQHLALKLALGSLYAAPDQVQKALAVDVDAPPKAMPAIVDIGAGSGSWAIEMAHEFPNAEVVAIDLVPPANLTNVPPNLRFEVDDCNLSLAHYANCFNVAHLRAIEMGITDFENLLYEVAQILRPDGVILLASPDRQVFDRHGKPLPVVSEGEPGFTWIQKLFAIGWDALKARSTSLVTARDHWVDWLKHNPNFEDVKMFEIDLPVGPWVEGNPRAMKVGELMRKDIAELLQAVKPLLVAVEGYPEDMVNRWLEEQRREMYELKHHLCNRWRFVSAKRTGSPWVNNPAESMHEHH